MLYSYKIVGALVSDVSPTDQPVAFLPPIPKVPQAPKQHHHWGPSVQTCGCGRYFTFKPHSSLKWD